jgi:hypothetical protein
VKKKTYDCRTAFSDVITSWSNLRSLLPASAGIVELWAILVAADLNMVKDKVKVMVDVYVVVRCAANRSSGLLSGANSLVDPCWRVVCRRHRRFSHSHVFSSQWYLNNPIIDKTSASL